MSLDLYRRRFQITDDDDPRLEYECDTWIYAFDSAHLNRFLGFVEGRVMCTIPSWWESAFVTCRIYGEDSMAFVGDDEEFSGFTCDRFDEDLVIVHPDDIVLTNAKLSSDRLSISVQAKDDVAVLKLRVSSSEARAGILLAVDVTSGYCAYLQADDKIAWPYHVSYMSWDTSEVLWTARVWAGVAEDMLRGGTTGGIPEHRATVHLTSNRVFVFGGSSGQGMYLEVFNRSDGKCVGRFSTDYWLHYCGPGFLDKEIERVQRWWRRQRGAP